ncbi:MAG: T9SS type A sorting domain-containing protein [Calditrichaeota bacterium]|nr:T9SS type A sorting domain-containing protein [Calditrichota bacterium]
MKRFFLFQILFSVIFVFSLLAQQTENSDDFLKREAEGKNRMAKKWLTEDGNTTPNMDKYDVTYYQLNLELVPSQKFLTGFVQMNAKILQPVNSIDVHLVYSLYPDSVLVDGQNVSTSFSGGILTFYFADTKNTNEAFSAKIFYHGYPASAGFGFDQDSGQPMIWSLSEPYAARTWWPCKDTPSDKADSADIVITVPENLIVASNGLLREEKTLPDNKKQYWWHEKYPIATYLISIAAHPFHFYSDEYVTLSGDTMPIQFYVFPRNYQGNLNDYAKTKDMIHAYASLFGEYPFVEEKYGHAEFLGWASGMEHQTLTSLHGVGETLIAHELAHQWWGDMITCNSFHHIWLNEGFATYSEALWMEWSHGKAYYRQYQKNHFYYGPGTIYVEDPEHDVIFDGNLSYRKASCVLHMLRHVVGDSTFFQILHTYYNDPLRKYGTATTEQFQAVCEQVSGMDLTDFFHQWIYEQGFPYYQYFYATKMLPDNRYYLFSTIKQIQSFGPIFKMPVDVTVETADGDTTFVVWTQNEIDTFSVILPHEPLKITLDKDDWILCKKEFSAQPFFTAKSYKILDENGNKNGRWDAGETVQLKLSTLNNGMALENASVILRVSDPLVTIQDSTAAIGSVNYQEIFTNENEPFVVSSDPSISGKMIPFQLQVFENDNFVGKATFSIPVGKPSILLLDDDNNQNYETYYQNALESNYNYFDYWDSQSKIFPDSLTRYKTVIWFQGMQTTNLLPNTFRSVLVDFINQGGDLIVFSQNLAEFVASSGDAAKIAFLADYFGVQFETGATSESVIVGKSGDPISSGMAITFTGPYGLDNQHSRDEMSPVNGAHSIFKYLQSQKSAGIRFEPMATDAKIVYLAFGLEGVAGPSEDTGSKLMSNIFKWFNPLTDVPETENVSLSPKSFQLFQNYPNPFNPETNIHFFLPEATMASISIYNISGQRIRTLFEAKKSAGSYSILWDGKDENGNLAASGIYIYRLITKEFSQQKKMILIH